MKPKPIYNGLANPLNLVYLAFTYRYDIKPETIYFKYYAACMYYM